MKFAAGLVAILALTLAGCRTGKSGGTGDHYATIADVKPGAIIPAKATLKIGEIDIPVDVDQAEKGQEMTLGFAAHGQTFETEVYRADGTTFNVVDAAGEHYDPPLPLLKFPMDVGDTWNWAGSMVAGDAPHNATATVTTTSETVLLPSIGSASSILVVVDLFIESGGPKPASRKLRFWFVPSKGLVKRQFGSASSREPFE